MSKRIQIFDPKDEEEEDEDLRYLLEEYIRRSEELEERESKVMTEIELIQSAVLSIQEWAQCLSSETVHLDVNHVEEETRLIQEETIRIQEEVKRKIEENKKLEEEVRKRKEQRLTNEFFDNGKNNKTENEIREIKDGTFFDEKLKKLKEMEKKLKEDTKRKMEELKKKEKSQKEQLELLELGSKINKELFASLQRRIF